MGLKFQIMIQSLLWKNELLYISLNIRIPYIQVNSIDERRHINDKDYKDSGYITNIPLP